jgi:hypothetical protein
VLAQNPTGGFKIIVEASGKTGSPAIQEAAERLPLPGSDHLNAQFYLINCQFAENMASENIYLVPTTNTSCGGAGGLNVRT